MPKMMDERDGAVRLMNFLGLASRRGINRPQTMLEGKPHHEIRRAEIPLNQRVIIRLSLVASHALMGARHGAMSAASGGMAAQIAWRSSGNFTTRFTPKDARASASCSGVNW